MKAITEMWKTWKTCKHAIMQKKSWQDHSRQTNTLFSLQRRDVTAVELIPPGRNDQAHFGVDNIAVLCTGFFPSTAVSIAGLQSQSNSIKANSVRFFPQGSQQAPCLGVRNLTNRSYKHSMFTHADSLRVFEKLARCQHSRIQTLALRFPQTNQQRSMPSFVIFQLTNQTGCNEGLVALVLAFLQYRQKKNNIARTQKKEKHTI